MPATITHVAEQWDEFFDAVDEFLENVASVIGYYNDAELLSYVKLGEKASEALRKYKELRERKWPDHPLFNMILSHMDTVSEALKYLRTLAYELNIGVTGLDSRFSSGTYRELDGLVMYMSNMIGSMISIIEDEILTFYIDAFYDLGLVGEDEGELGDE